MYKLITLILLFLLIFINISFGRNCKCPKNEKVISRRYKRGVGCSCLGKKEKEKGYNSDKERKRKGKQIVVDEEEEEIFKDEEIEDFEECSDNDEIKEEKLNKKVLYICDNFHYSHLQFNTTLVKLLRGKYNTVDLIVYYHSSRIKRIKINVKFIKVEINTSRFDNGYLDPEELLIKYKHSSDYKYVGIYYEIMMKNQKVEIGNKQIGIFDYLKKQSYDIGIAEFDDMNGSFAVFEALNIKNTFNAFPSIFTPQYLQFLNINDEKIYKIPAFNYAEPGDWDKEKGICNINSERYKENKEKQEKLAEGINEIYTTIVPKLYDDLFENKNIKGINEPPNFVDLFKKIKYHFINQNKFGIFEDFPKNDKIIYIGGILVEDKGILTKEKELTPNDHSCVVYLSFGTVKIDRNFSTLRDVGAIKQMFNAFGNHKNCLFKLRINKKYLPEKYSKKKIEILEGHVNQQKILFKQNTKLFISHCGQNSLNEAMYAGVPLICIPFEYDQFYNSSFIEQKSIGIYVKGYSFIKKKMNKNFGKDFKNALNKLLKKDKNGHYNSKYHIAANELRNKIHNEMNNGMIKEHFLEKIDEDI